MELVTDRQKHKQLPSLIEAFERSALSAEMRPPALPPADTNNHKEDRDHKAEQGEAAAHQPGVLWQLAVLTGRNMKLAVRQPELLAGRVGLFVTMALVLGTLFWRRGDKRSLVAAQQVISFVVFSVAMACFTSLQALPVCMRPSIVSVRVC